MRSFIYRTTMTTALSLAAIVLPLAAHAEVHSRSREIVVLAPKDLPAAAQQPGEAFFLHSDDAGSTYLYVEQENGSRLSIFDVSDPARISLSSTVRLETTGAFDVERPLGDNAELVRFHDKEGAAILDLRKAKMPTLSAAVAFEQSSEIVILGNTALLSIDRPPHELVPIARNIRIIDTANPSVVTVIATVNNVEHQLSREETGTTFLLGSDGLTIVRRVSVEDDYKTHQTQMSGN